MAAIDFPNSPSNNDTFTSGGVSWRYDGSKWRIVAGSILSSANPTTIQPDASAAPGSETTAARADHAHEILTASAGTITGVSNAEGSSSSFARADHTHAISLPRCTATRTTTQSLNNLALVAISLTSETIDTDSFHDNSTNPSRITIPAGLGGDYLVSANLMFADSSTGRRSAFIRKNGADLLPALHVASMAIDGGPSGRLSVSGVLSLVATDYLELFGFHAHGSALDVTNATLSIVRVG